MVLRAMGAGLAGLVLAGVATAALGAGAAAIAIAACAARRKAKASTEWPEDRLAADDPA